MRGGFIFLEGSEMMFAMIYQVEPLSSEWSLAQWAEKTWERSTKKLLKTKPPLAHWVTSPART
jgi:hypothetical protein